MRKDGRYPIARGEVRVLEPSSRFKQKCTLRKSPGDLLECRAETPGRGLQRRSSGVGAGWGLQRPDAPMALESYARPQPGSWASAPAPPPGCGIW